MKTGKCSLAHGSSQALLVTSQQRAMRLDTRVFNQSGIELRANVYGMGIVDWVIVIVCLRVPNRAVMAVQSYKILGKDARMTLPGYCPSVQCFTRRLDGT